MATRQVDVLLVGGGLSGIGVAWHLQQKCPAKRYAILEARASLGGTWDLFRYPGIRSDSRMHLYSYSFRPFPGERSIAPGGQILRYLEDTARDHGIDRHIHLHTRAKHASWSSARGRWTVTAQRTDTGEQQTYDCRWLQMCSGYYSYRAGYTPEFAGREQFGGEIIHPQSWPEDFDPSGKRIVVIGSGATAITLIPSLAKRAKHVVMLQRSPSYIYVMPAVDEVAMKLRRLLPLGLANKLARQKDLLLEAFGFYMARNQPDKFKRFLMRGVKAALPRGYAVDKHFTPHYAPWDQRVCVSPDGDLFRAIRNGSASVMTDHIKRFSERGLVLKSGEELEADVIVTATGLNMQVGGEMTIEVDGRTCEQHNHWIYKGVMLSGIPNMMLTSGTLIASYTLRVELTAEYLCRVLQHMDRTRTDLAMPTLPVDEQDMPRRPFVSGFSSGYLMRAIDSFPMQGGGEPWVNAQSYHDNKRILSGPIDDGALAFRHMTGPVSGA